MSETAVLAPPLGRLRVVSAKMAFPSQKRDFSQNQRRRYLNVRENRYSYRYLVRNCYNEAGRAMGLEYPSDFHATALCGVLLLADQVALKYGLDTSTAFYSGLMSCGRVHTCPVCQAKIQERRREEISNAMESAVTDGKKCVMVTLTFPHKSFDKLNEMLVKHAAALKMFRDGRMLKKELLFSGYIGLIRCLEITAGVNGWHPHTHELWFVDKDCDAYHLQKTILDQWEHACKETGLLTEDKVIDFRRRAVDVKDNARNSDYIAKMKDGHWGADREIAKASGKSSGGAHPFELLCECCGALPLSKERRKEMFLEYTKAIHGKRQLFWTRSLRNRYAVVEVSDQEIVDAPDEIGIIMGMISSARWKIVLREVAEAELLKRAETGGWQSVEDWFTERE